MIRITKLALACIAIIFASCSEENSENFEAESFTRIFDNNRFSDSYSPIAAVQTPDNGYVVLATRFLPNVLNGNIYLLKADEHGQFVKDLTMEEAFTNPVSGLTIIADKLNFICMSAESQAKLVTVDLNLDQLAITDLPLTYPSAATFVDNEFLLLSYDQVERKMVFSRVSSTGNVLVSRNFKVSDDDSLEDEILKHFLKTGTQYPFQVGKTSSGVFFFNGFSDYTFSLVFTDLSDDDDVDGVVQGQQEDGGFSAIVPMGGSRFAAAYFNFGNNYIVPQTSLSMNTPTSIEGLGGYDMREIVPGSKVQILRTVVAGKNVLVYASNTRSKQIGIFMYDEATGAFLGSKYLGFSNPYELGYLMQTDDDGLAIAGTTFIAGRFPRICLIKLSAEEFSAIEQQ